MRTRLGHMKFKRRLHPIHGYVWEATSEVFEDYLITKRLAGGYWLYYPHATRCDYRSLALAKTAALLHAFVREERVRLL